MSVSYMGICFYILDEQNQLSGLSNNKIILFIICSSKATFFILVLNSVCRQSDTYFGLVLFAWINISNKTWRLCVLHYLSVFFCLLHLFLFPSYCSPDLSPSPKSCPMNQSGWQCVAVKEPVRVICHVKLGQDLVGLGRQQEKKRFWKIPLKQQLLLAFQHLCCNCFQF